MVNKKGTMKNRTLTPADDEHDDDLKDVRSYVFHNQKHARMSLVNVIYPGCEFPGTRAWCGAKTGSTRPGVCSSLSSHSFGIGFISNELKDREVVERSRIEACALIRLKYALL
jgi:hypothetical protein